MQQPHEFSRRILLLVTGMSPQVVTETVYALTMQAEPFVPTEVHVVTTQDGAREARLTLIVNGWFRKLCQTYSLRDIVFDENNIHVVTNSAGLPLTDIRSAEENDAVANYITEKVREFAADEQAALHVSLAGGRKTMGFFMGYALSLFARDQDRLSHVLVSEPFESNREFFFPTPDSQTINLPDGRHADASDAKVILADIPIVMMQHGSQQGLLKGKLSYLSAVQSVRASLGPARLVIKPRDQKIIADGREIDLPPWEFCLLACLAFRAKRELTGYVAPIKGGHDEDWAKEFLADLQDVFDPPQRKNPQHPVPGSLAQLLAAPRDPVTSGRQEPLDRLRQSLNSDCSSDKISPHVSDLRKHLYEMLGERAYFYINRKSAKRGKGAVAYEVPLGKDAIKFEY